MHSFAQYMTKKMISIPGLSLSGSIM